MANSVFIWPGIATSSGGSTTFIGPIISTGSTTAQVDGIATTSTDGFVSLNSTAATSGVPVQMSPRALFTGQGWDTDDTVSRPARFGWQTLPVSGTTVSGVAELIWLDPITNAITKPFTISQSGEASFLGLVSTGSSFRAAATGTFSFGTSRSIIEAPASGQINFVNVSGSAAVGFDFDTNNLLKIRTRAQTGYATVDCLGLKASGAAGASFGPSAVSSITVVNGIITAIS